MADTTIPTRIELARRHLAKLDADLVNYRAKLAEYQDKADPTQDDLNWIIALTSMITDLELAYSNMAVALAAEENRNA